MHGQGPHRTDTLGLHQMQRLAQKQDVCLVLLGLFQLGFDVPHRLGLWHVHTQGLCELLPRHEHEHKLPAGEVKPARLHARYICRSVASVRYRVTLNTAAEWVELVVSHDNLRYNAASEEEGECEQLEDRHSL